MRVLAGDKSRDGVPGYISVQNEVFDGLPITRVALTRISHRPVTTCRIQRSRVFSLKLIADWQPDVIHAHHMAGLSLGILQLARAHGIRIALTLHDHWGFCG